MERDYSMPAAWQPIIDQLDEVCSTLRAYMDQEPLWRPGSQAELELEQDPEFEPFPYASPMTHALLSIGQSLAMALDHLTSITAVLQTEHAMFSVLTLLRTYFVACAQAWDVADPRRDAKARLTAAMNVQLDSDLELMRFLEGEPGWNVYDAHRRDVVSAAVKLGWHVERREPKAGKPPLDWYIGNKPLHEMVLVDNLMRVGGESGFGRAMYRLLSASTHSQPHVLPILMMPEDAAHAGRGYSIVPMGMTAERLLFWLTPAVGAMTVAMVRVMTLFDWNPLRWNSVVIPITKAWHASLEVTTSRRISI